MADRKKFYWLKLKDTFFTQPKVKKLRKVAGGTTYTIIYLKMQLLSLTNFGVIKFENVEKTFASELALILDESVDDVVLCLQYLTLHNLIEQNNDEYLLTEAVNNIGSECDSAERVRQFRAKQDDILLLCNGDVTLCNTERREKREDNKSKSKDIENTEDSPPKIIKHKYGTYKNVLLTDEQLDKLKVKYSDWEKKIETLSEGIELKGYKYKNHYLAVIKWARNDTVKNQANGNDFMSIAEKL